MSLVTKEQAPQPVAAERVSMSSTYVIMRPGGNDTALVFGVVADPAERKRINDAIMADFPEVEQVGFINDDPEAAELMMAGGESCGNALRSTAYVILGGKEGSLRIKMSGAEEPLEAGVDADQNGWAQMPVYPEVSRIEEVGDGMTLVNMKGISHVIMDDPWASVAEENLDTEAVKSRALDILKRLGLTESLDASGVMFLQRTAEGISIRPVVYVRSIDTLFYETACGTGTTAVGLLEALNSEDSVSVSVAQPSGMPITIDVTFDKGRFTDARISGPVQVVADNQKVSV